MNTSYNTDRLVLRVCTKFDARSILCFYKRNLSDFARYEIIDPKTCLTLRYHETALNAEFSMFSQGKMVRYHIFEKDDPLTVIGTFAFHDIEYGNYRSARVGYKIDKDYRRLGYAKEALSKGISVMFDELNLHRLEAFVMPTNTPSIRLLESLGFHQEGLIHDKVIINNAWQDHYLYALINENE